MIEPTTELLESIAKTHLDVPSLARTMSGADFQSVSRWEIDKALRAAFQAGAEAASGETKSADEMRSALQWLLDDMHDAGATVSFPDAVSPSVGIQGSPGRMVICDSAMNAARILSANGGTSPFKLEA